MLEIDETELKLLLEKRKKFINGSNFAEFGEIISGISLAITLLVTDCSKITFMPSLYFELIVWAITASILGHGIYRLIVSKKHSYSIKNLYDEVVDLDPKTEHSFNIVVFRNIHEKGKYLLFYSKRWQCWLFPNYRCQDGKFDENAETKQIKANIKRDLKITDRIVIYVYCSNALYNHSIPIALKNIVKLTIINNVFSSFNLCTLHKAKIKTKYAIMLIIILIINIS